MTGPRVVITGGPKVGKTTTAMRLSAALDVPVRHTDDVKHLQWSEASEVVATWLGGPGPWIVEGVATMRAARKWLEAHPHGRPFDLLVVLLEPKLPLTPGQDAMGKGLHTVLEKIRAELVARGVDIVEATEVTTQQIQEGTAAPPILTPEQRARARELIDKHGVSPAAAQAQVLDGDAVEALADTQRTCEGCGTVAHVPRLLERWQCLTCGRVHAPQLAKP